MNGHNLKPGGFAAALAVLIAVVLASCSPKGASGGDAACGLSDEDFRTEGILEAIPVRATFLDEVSWDIPHQNWGVREWDADFRAMKNMGINTVVLIRAGLGRWIAAPFECLLESEEVYYPPVDLVEMFLTLADKYGMAFYFGMYDSGKYWQEGLFRREIDLNLKLIDEVWARYGHHKSFQGWYLSQEISRRTKNMSRIYAEVGRHAKAVSGGLKTMISPYIHGIKTDQVMAGDKALSVEEHRREWNEILGNVAGAVDILAFQDGQVDYHELYDYLVVNKALADKYGMECWTNIESFDRDMPIRFLPIKWEKLLLKLDAARRDIFTIATAIILKSTTLTGNGECSMKQRADISYMLFLAVTAAVGGLLFGYDTAVIFGTVELVTARFGLDSLQQGWYVGCALAGSIAGVLCAGVLSDRLGRRRTMLVSAVLFTVSAVGCALCADFTQLVVYRIVGGLGIGVVSIVSPLYISEVSAAGRPRSGGFCCRKASGRRAAGGVHVLCFLLRHLRLRRGMGAFVGDVSDSCARRGDVDRGVLALDGDLFGRAAYAVDARESDAGGDFFPLRRDVRALYAADMEGGAGDVGPHARRDRTILDKVTI